MRRHIASRRRGYGGVAAAHSGQITNGGGHDSVVEVEILVTCYCATTLRAVTCLVWQQY